MFRFVLSSLFCLSASAVVVRDYNKVDYYEFSSLDDFRSAFFPHDIASMNVRAASSLSSLVPFLVVSLIEIVARWRC
jgi:hypothetical protein